MYLIGFRASIADEKEVHHLNIRVSTVTESRTSNTTYSSLFQVVECPDIEQHQWTTETLQFEDISMQRLARNWINVSHYHCPSLCWPRFSSGLSCVLETSCLSPQQPGALYEIPAWCKHGYIVYIDNNWSSSTSIFPRWKNLASWPCWPLIPSQGKLCRRNQMLRVKYKQCRRC